MLSKRTIALSLCLALYIGTVILTPYYASSTIPTQQNTSKEFMLSSEPWLTGFSYRMNITIDAGNTAGAGYQVKIDVPYSSFMQSDYDDIRFTDNDKTTELDYWREDYNATYGVFWVKIADAIPSNIIVYMYYGNPTATTTSNGTATFPFYEDWTSETIGSDWTVENSDGSVSFDDTHANHGSVIKVEGNAGAYVYSFYSDADFNQSYALRLRSNTEKTAAASQNTKQGWNDADGNGYSMIESYQGAARIVVRDDDANTDHQNIADSNYAAWNVFDAIRYQDTQAPFTHYTTWYTNGSMIATGDMDPDDTGKNVFFYVRDSEYDTYNDWVVVRDYVFEGPSFDSFGDPEGFAWREIDEVELVFSVPIDPWALDMLVIFIGLGMGIFSTSYLAYKISNRSKSPITTESGLIIVFLFMVGWGLFFGGIM